MTHLAPGIVFTLLVLSCHCGEWRSMSDEEFIRVDQNRQRPEPLFKRGDRARLTRDSQSYSRPRKGDEVVILGVSMTHEGDIGLGPWLYHSYFEAGGFSLGFYSGLEYIGKNPVAPEQLFDGPAPTPEE